MKKIVIQGSSKEIDKIIQENRVRFSRGLISFEVVSDIENNEIKDDEQDSPIARKRTLETRSKSTIVEDTKRI